MNDFPVLANFSTYHHLGKTGEECQQEVDKIYIEPLVFCQDWGFSFLRIFSMEAFKDKVYLAFPANYRDNFFS
jgi:hypothetical protein